MMRHLSRHLSVWLAILTVIVIASAFIGPDDQGVSSPDVEAQ